MLRKHGLNQMSVLRGQIFCQIKIILIIPHFFRAG